MNSLRLHLWREWREHRLALLMLVLVLPLLSWGIARVPPKAVLGDPLIQSGVALGFVVVLLVATGGELLGLERRGHGLRWLERLPRGLETAFLAKLLFLVITTALAAVYGLGVVRSIAALRGVTPRAIRWEPFSLIAGLALVLWTFACSAWALRGGLSILAAVSVLGFVGYPAWLLVSEGYEPSPTELWTAGTLLPLGALAGAVLGFLRGGRFGRGTAKATLLGLAPVVPLLVISNAWSLDRFELRERIDPLVPEFAIQSAWVSEDGRTALLGCSMWHEQWNDMPTHVLRVDLESGRWEKVGRNAWIEPHGAEIEQGPVAAETCVAVSSQEDPAAQRLYAASDAAPMPLKALLEHQNGWVTSSAGLGWIVFRGPFRHLPVFYDPHRRLSVPLDELGLEGYSDVCIGPERWLVREDLEWFEYVPGFELERATWMDDVTEAGPMLPDGRMFVGLRYMEYGLVDPAARKVTSLCASEAGVAWLGSPYRYRSVFRPGERVLLDTPDGRFLFDEASTTLTRVHGETLEYCIRSLPDGSVILVDESGRLVRQDLATDQRTVLFPVAD